MKSLFGLMAAFCLLALPSKSFAHSNTAPATFDSIAIAHGGPPSANAEPTHIGAIPEASVSIAFVSEHSETVIRAGHATHETALAALHRLHDADRNRAVAQLTYLVKDRSRDLGLTANYDAPMRLRHQWRSVPDARPPANHLAIDKLLFG